MDTPTESSVFGTLFLRFCHCVAARGGSIVSIVFIVKHTSHSFGQNMLCHDYLRLLASVGEPFGPLCLLWGTSCAVFLIPLFRGTG